jgi:hypothetical protein
MSRLVAGKQHSPASLFKRLMVIALAYQTSVRQLNRLATGVFIAVCGRRSRLIYFYASKLDNLCVLRDFRGNEFPEICN